MTSMLIKKPKVASSAHPLQMDDEKVATLDSLLTPFQQKETIPTDIISSVLRASFPHHILVHAYSAQHQIIKMTIHDLIQGNHITNWVHNRPPDQERCEDIAKYIDASKKPVDTMMYVCLNHKKQKYDMIDGIHRYTALSILFEQSKHVDLITSEYGDLSQLMNSMILLNVRMNATEGEKTDLFLSLNKSNPVSELYLRNPEKEKKECVEGIVKSWQTEYKSHFSSTNKPNRPNTNRDRFMDILSEVYDRLKLTQETTAKLGETIHRVNQMISHNIPKQTSTEMQKKCKETGCWLFLYSDDALMNLLSNN
jgi:hypothetical protein